MPPFDVQNVIVGGGGGATLRSYAIDLTGSGGTLANGSVSIGGYDWTAYGIGTTAEAGLSIPLSSLWSSYDGAKHPVEVSAETPVWNMSQNYGTTGIRRKRADSEGGTAAYGVVGGYITGAHVPSFYQQTYIQVDGSYSQTATYQDYTVRRISGVFNGRTVLGSYSSNTASASFRCVEDFPLKGLTVTDSTAATYTNPFTTTDELNIFGGVYAGTTANTITQDASGITITTGNQVVTWRALYIFLGSTETA